LVIGIGVFGVYSLNQLSANTKEILQENQPILTNMAAIESDVLFHSLKVDQYIATGNRARLRAVEELRSDVERRLDELEAQVQGTEDESLVQEIQVAYDTYISLSDELQSYYQRNPGDTAAIEGRQTRIAALLENSLLAKADDLYTAAEQKAQELVQANTELYQIYIGITVAASVLLFALVLVLSYFTSRSIVVPIDQLAQTTEMVAEGDFTARAQVRTGDEIALLADGFNSMTARLQELVETLEQRVAERTRDLEQRSVELEAASQVARTAAAIRDVDLLLDQVVDLISERFGFYHAGVFLNDNVGEYTILRAASSEGGKQMLAQGHRLRIGEVGVVGYAAGTGQPRVALDVGEDAQYFDNPDLPLTRSEMALPLKLREQIIGVLDVQSTDEAAFTHEDVAVLQTMADQIALAIENARLLAQSEQALAELEIFFGQRLQEAWQRAVREPISTYRYTSLGVEPVPEYPVPKIPSEQRASMTMQKDDRRLVIPISLRDQVLGSLTLQRESEQAPWSKEERALVTELSTQIGLALEYARSLEETQRRAAREQLVGEVTGRMREPLQLEDVLQTAVNEIRQALNLDELVVRLRSSEQVTEAEGQG
jgi:nitrate/nitrite-specific signal transduction histidine kinase